MTKKILAIMMLMFMSQIEGPITKAQIETLSAPQVSSAGQDHAKTPNPDSILEILKQPNTFYNLTDGANTYLVTEETTEEKTGEKKVRVKCGVEGKTPDLVLTHKEMESLKKLLVHNKNGYNTEKPVVITDSFKVNTDYSGYWVSTICVIDIQSDDGENFYFVVNRFEKKDMPNYGDQSFPEIEDQQIQRFKQDYEMYLERWNRGEIRFTTSSESQEAIKNKREYMNRSIREHRKTKAYEDIKASPENQAILRPQKIEYLKEKIGFIDPCSMGAHQTKANVASGVGTVVGGVGGAVYGFGGGLVALARTGATVAANAEHFYNVGRGTQSRVTNALTGEISETSYNPASVPDDIKKGIGIAGGVYGAVHGAVKGVFVTPVKFGGQKAGKAYQAIKEGTESLVGEITGTKIDSSNRIIVHTSSLRYTYITLSDDEMVELYNFFEDAVKKPESRQIYTIIKDQKGISITGNGYHYRYTFYPNGTFIYVTPAYMYKKK